jgi:pilus assembly protein CpaE
MPAWVEAHVSDQSHFGGVESLDHSVTVAILEPHDETRHHVFAMADRSPHLQTRVFRELIPFFEMYGRSQGPDILLVGLDTQPQEALAAIRRIVSLMPACGVIVFGREQATTQDLLLDAMAAGAHRYLGYPFDSTTMTAAIRDVHRQMAVRPEAKHPAEPSAALPVLESGATGGKVLTLFGPKGGVGTTTLAVNLACSLIRLGHRVVLVDGNVTFGTVGLFLNLESSTTMLELVDAAGGVHEASVANGLVAHRSGLKVLLSPLRPEESDRITGGHLDRIITLLRESFDYVVVDTCPSCDERVLLLLERADRILVPTGAELPSIKNLRSFLRLAQVRGYPDQRLVPVLMHAGNVPVAQLDSIEALLPRPLAWRIAGDDARVAEAMQDGEPFVLTHPDASVSRSIERLARWLVGQDVAVASVPAPRRRPFWKRGWLSPAVQGEATR